MEITAIKLAEEKFRAVLESAPDAMVIANRSGEIQLVNRQTEHLFGYTREELIGRAVEMLMPAGFRRGHVAERDGCMAAPSNRPMGAGMTLAGRRKDGSEFPVEISLSPLQTESETLVCSVIRDVTGRKKSEEAPRKSEERFRALVTASSDVLYRMSPDWSVMHQLSGRDFVADMKTASSTWLQDYIHPDDQALVLAASRLNETFPSPDFTYRNRSMKTFQNRTEAGQLLAAELMVYADRPDVIVLGLPRGGVPVACEVATALRAPLDVFVVRKLGTPGQPELAMGAIASGGVRVINDEVVRESGIPMDVIDAVAEEEGRELRRRELAYRGSHSEPEVRGKTVLLIDDGVATGSTMRAAIRALNSQQPARLVVAVPTAAGSTCRELRTEADEFVALMTPEPFHGVGEWYEDFSQTSDGEVTELLSRARRRMDEIRRFLRGFGMRG